MKSRREKEGIWGFLSLGILEKRFVNVNMTKSVLLESFIKTNNL